ncbi:diphosphomevalonate decarboxylase [Allofustis seminis]|uniref:diphosphomevalonate decarboxylase n=1 Tax=Allofustis seminis TaxID=166939 RepID=UPI00037235F7|nr:diphosphomevalonate decarboxylase [Allofustis seminis]
MNTKSSDWMRAYANIAFIKYWGKKDEALLLPQNNSLSLTLDAFYTDTKVEFSKDLMADELWINGQKQEAHALKKVQQILDIARELGQVTEYAKVSSYNAVPTAAGLASSASGLAALTAAVDDALGLHLSKQELSCLARRGSGSACRSIFGGFVEWQQGTDDSDSYAIPIDEANWDIGMIFVIVHDGKKDISSTEGMRRAVETSPFYNAWKSSCEKDLHEIKKAIKQRNLERVGQIAEHSALKMHSLNFSAQPPFNYWSPESIQVMNCVKDLRKAGYVAYFTMDAGPNVKIICKASEMDIIYDKLLSNYSPDQLVKALPGPGVQKVNEDQVMIIED